MNRRAESQLDPPARIHKANVEVAVEADAKADVEAEVDV
jgi:hypothetical protein